MVDMVVLKFGGKSLGTKEKIIKVCEYVKHRVIKDKVLMVVSAIGNTTDTLESIASNYEATNKREIDALISTGEMQSASICAMVLDNIGVKAISLNAFQLGICAKGEHGSGVITSVDKSYISSKFETYDVIVVTGFQGLNDKNEVITLGRGGSDTTAVALSIAFDCKVEIYSDFDGIYQGDPKRLNYKKLNSVNYLDMKKMADAGAKVLASSANNLAKCYSKKIVCKQSSNPNLNGTQVFEFKNQSININYVENLTKITINFANDIQKLQKSIKYVVKSVKFYDIYVKNDQIVLYLDSKYSKSAENQLAKLNDLLEE